MTLPFHPASEIFDLLDEADFAALGEDIRKHGLLTPIWLHPDGSILDGRNRYLACLEVGVSPKFQTWYGTGSAAEFVWSMNFTRRHLDGGAKKIAAARYAIQLEREARERQGRRTDLTSSSIEDEVVYGRSVEKAADKFDIGRATVERAVTVVKHAVPELVQMIERDEVAVSTAADVARLPQAEQHEIVARGEAEILEAAKRIRSERAAQKAAENAALKATTPVLVPAGKYHTIVIDPPWNTEKIPREVRPNQVAFDYPTMTEAEMAA